MAGVTLSSHIAGQPLGSPSWCPAERSGPSPSRAPWWSWSRGRGVWWSLGYSSAPRWDTPAGGTRTVACGSDTPTQTHTACPPTACSYTSGSQKCPQCRPEPYRTVCSPEGRRKRKNNQRQEKSITNYIYKSKKANSSDALTEYLNKGEKGKTLLDFTPW